MTSADSTEGPGMDLVVERDANLCGVAAWLPETISRVLERQVVDHADRRTYGSLPILAW